MEADFIWMFNDSFTDFFIVVLNISSASSRLQRFADVPKFVCVPNTSLRRGGGGGGSSYSSFLPKSAQIGLLPKLRPNFARISKFPKFQAGQCTTPAPARLLPPPPSYAYATMIFITFSLSTCIIFFLCIRAF